VWDAKYHILSDSPLPFCDYDIGHVAEVLRFSSEGAEQLTVSGGRVNPQQLQTMRQLTPASVRLLEVAADRPDFVVGQVYQRRRHVHDVYGGDLQGGIVTLSGAAIFLFTGPRGEEYGDRDGWDTNGVYLYTGEGQAGDMTFEGGNKAVRDHVADGRDLLLFESLGKGEGCRFAGRFTCGGWEYRRGADRNGEDRRAIVFHLFPDERAVAFPDEPDDVPDSLDDLRARAIAAARPVAAASSDPAETQRRYYERSALVRRYVLARAKGVCEACKGAAPFKRLDGSPYLEAHHTRRVSDGGPDHPRFVGAVCPTCHAWIHRGQGGRGLNQTLQAYLDRVEPPTG
jgi:5-methylcytosine-specific restriction protein A